MADKSVYKSMFVRPEEITPEHVYKNRRQFLKSMGVLGASALLAACKPQFSSETVTSTSPTEKVTTAEAIELAATGSQTYSDELGDAANTFEEITNYNNYYEFSLDKGEVAELSKDFRTSPWEVQVTGLVNKPRTFRIEDLLKKFPQEERIYRLRCVEAWSMVIPWIGFSLASLLKEVEPLSTAKYVRFESILDAEQMRGQKRGSWPWPYQEGLRMDEAMHDLTILATGLYGKPMPNQNGAPVRLIIPWKYGFKSLKAIVKIELVPEEPETFWSAIAPNEYGFYANVNPQVSHPRWSQASERRIGESGRRKTLMFNGYEEQVASLYAGMNLEENF